LQRLLQEGQHGAPPDLEFSRGGHKLPGTSVPRRLEWMMSMPGLEGSDYRQNGFASASARVSVERTGPQVSSVEALDWDSYRCRYARARACAGACESLSTDEGGTAYGGKSPTQNGEEPGRPVYAGGELQFRRTGRWASGPATLSLT
jgi:hypothetical protein